MLQKLHFSRMKSSQTVILFLPDIRLQNNQQPSRVKKQHKVEKALDVSVGVGEGSVEVLQATQCTAPVSVLSAHTAITESFQQSLSAPETPAHHSD